MWVYKVKYKTDSSVKRYKAPLVAKGYAQQHDMRDQGDPHYFLGIEVIRTLEGILISQRHYVLSMLVNCGMAHYKSISTPLNRTVKLCPDSGKVCDPKRF